MYLDDPIGAIKRKASNVVYYSSDSFPSNVKAAPDDIAIVFINSRFRREPRHSGWQ